jgi:hypothetical protein
MNFIHAMNECNFLLFVSYLTKLDSEQCIGSGLEPYMYLNAITLAIWAEVIQSLV